MKIIPKLPSDTLLICSTANHLDQYSKANYNGDHLNHATRKLVFGVCDQHRSNWPVQPHKLGRGLISGYRNKRFYTI